MGQERILDVIDHARNFHSQLGRYYDSLGAMADRDRVKIFLDYLSACAKRHEQALAEYEEDAPREIVDTWLTCESDTLIGKALELKSLTPDMDVDTVLREALRLDECLSEMYREVIDRAPGERVREVFTRLLETNQKEMQNLVRDSGHLHDW